MNSIGIQKTKFTMTVIKRDFNDSIELNSYYVA